MYVAFLTLRYLLGRRISALATLLAVIFGVATLFTVLSVMEGYRVKLRELVRGLESHLTVQGLRSFSLRGGADLETAIRSVPLVAATADYIQTVALYRSFGRFSYLQLRGIDPLKEAQVGDLARHLLSERELKGLEEILQVGTQSGEPPPRPELEKRLRALLGENRAPLPPAEIERLFSRVFRLETLARANPGRPLDPRAAVPAAMVVGVHLLLDREIFLGDEVQVITLGPDGGKPVLERFVVVGAFKSGEFETDSRTALVRVEKLRTLLDLFDPLSGEPLSEGVRVALHDWRQAPEAREAVARAIARQVTGKKLETVIEAVARTPSLLGEEWMKQMLEPPGQGQAELTPELRAELEQARAELEEAVAILASPESTRQAVEAARAAYRMELERLGERVGLVSEEQLLFEPPQAARRTWHAALGLEEGMAPAARAEDRMQERARRVVLQEASRMLEEQIQDLVDDFLAQVRTWEDRQQILLTAVEREKRIVGFLVLLINGFIACLVLLMLVLLVIEKTRDLGVLLALGATPRGVMSLFLTTGLVLVTLGVGAGLGLGYLFTLIINPLHDAVHALTGWLLFDPETYRLDRLPTTISVGEVLASVLPSVLFGLLASLVPAVWASRQDPIKAIHYE